MRVRNTFIWPPGLPSSAALSSRPAPFLALGSGRPGATLSCALLCLLLAASSYAASIHTENFDFGSMGTGNLHGQDSWVANPTDAGQVQNTAFAAGDQGVSITNDGSVASGATISRSFTVGASTNIVWTEWMARPQPMLRSSFLFDTNATVLFYVNDSNKLVVYNGTTTNALSTTVTPDTWTRFTVRSDYSAKTWDLWVDRTSVVTGLGFYNTGATGFSDLGVSHGSTDGALAYVDELDINGIVKQSSAADATLDFSETFESYQIGSLYGQSSWTVSDDDSAMVQAYAVQTGTWAASIENNNGNSSFSTLSQGVNDSTATNEVWSDFYAQPVFATRATVVPDDDATTAFYVDDATDRLVVFDGTNRLVLANQAALTEGSWTRFTVGADYQSGTWDIWVDGAAYALDLGFYNASVSQFASFNVQEGETASDTSYVDSIAITAAKPGDIVDDGPTVSIADAGATEGDAGTVAMSFTVTLDTTLDQDVTFDFGTSDSTATAGADYTATNGSLTIVAGATTTEINVVVDGDTFGENNETLTVTLSNIVAAVFTDATATGTITDNDEQPAANVLGGATGISTTEATANISVTSTGGAPTEAWVFWGESDGTTYKPDENPGSDWDFGRYVGPVGVEDVTGVMTGLTANTLYYFCTYVSNAHLQVWSDTRQFSTGPWTLDFSEDAESLLTGNIQGQRGWEVTPNALATVISNSAAANGGDHYVTVTNSVGGSATTLSHPFTDSTATNEVWSDFYAKVRHVSREFVGVNPNATTAFFVNDSGELVVFDGTTKTNLASKPLIAEGSWTRFTVKADYDAATWSIWVGADPYAAGLDFHNASATQFEQFAVDEGDTAGTSALDDLAITTTAPAGIGDLPEITISAATSVTNHAATLNATLVATNGASTDVYVAYGTNDESTVVANWDTNVLVSSAASPGGTTKPVTGLTASEDYVYRFFASNSVGVAWTDATNFTTEVASMSIADATPVTEPDGAATIDATFTVSLSGASASNVTATFAANSGTADEDVDFVDTNGTVNITAGTTSADIVVVVRGDDAGEPTEMFTVTLASPANAAITDASGTGTINDNDEQPAANVLGGAMSISTSEATANISVTSTGGAPTEAWVFWGESDGTTYKPDENPGSDWDFGRYVGPVGVEDVTGVMTGLTANTLYYFRTYVSNTYTEAWSATRQFTTGPWELDFSETFETLLTDNIQGQRGWENSPNYLASVQSGGAQGGSQYGLLTNSSARSATTLSHGFDNTAAINEVWSDFYAKPVFASRTNVVPNDDATTAFFVNSSGKVVVFDGTAKTTLTSKPSVTVDTWTRFTVKADYTAKTWSLWVDKVEMDTGLGFYNSAITQFEIFAVDEGSESGLATLDSIDISTTVPSDLLEAAGTLFKFR